MHNVNEEAKSTTPPPAPATEATEAQVAPAASSAPKTPVKVPVQAAAPKAESPTKEAPKGGATEQSQRADVSLSNEMEQEIEAAMAIADPGTQAASKSAAPSSQASPKAGANAAAGGTGGAGGAGGARAIRGPRRVEAGREHRKGRVVSVNNQDVFIEFGPKELGIAPLSGWTTAKAPDPKEGEEIDVVVERFDQNESVFVCSRPGAVQKAAWEHLEVGQVVEAKVTGTNKGGLELEVAGHRAFMPASQVNIHRTEDLTKFVGEKMACKVRKIERAGRGNIVLSRRDVLTEERKEQQTELRGKLSVGDVLEGTVQRVEEFGAFVDIGGADGLVHISDLSHDRVRKVEDVVKAGQTVKVKVTKIDWDKNRISLSIKETQDDPFKTAGETLTEGEEVSGKVTAIMEFGAFVEVAPGVEGLVHISEIDWKRVQKVEHILKEGQVVNCKVLEVDAKKRRVSLSIKQTKTPPKDAKTTTRTEEEIRKETPQLRRMREEFNKKKKAVEKSSSGGGLGNISDYLGDGLGSLKF